MAGVSVDGFDLETIGFIVREVPGWRDAVGHRIPTRSRPGRLGVAAMSADEEAGGRTLRIRGYQKASDLATLQSRRDELLHRLWGADIEVVLPDDTDRVFFCRLDGRVQVEGLQPKLSSPKHQVTIPVLLEDPRIYSSLQDQITIASDDASPTDVPMGSAPTEPSIEVDQASFTLIYRDSGGTEVARLEVSGASAAPVTVDMDDQTITVGGSGEIDTLAAGDFFSLDPRDGDFPSSTWPQMEVVTGTGSVATATITYRRAWL